MPSKRWPRVTCSALYDAARSSLFKPSRNRCFYSDHDVWIARLYSTRTCPSFSSWNHECSFEEETRPPDISRIDWMLLQHSRLWRAHLSARSYRALFGVYNKELRTTGVRQIGRAWEWHKPSVAMWMREAQKRGFSDDADYPSQEGFGAGIAGLSGGITGGFAKESHWTEYPKKIDIEEEDEFATGSRYEAWQRDNIAFTAPYKPRPYRTLETEETECELECGTPSGLTQSTIKATPADSYAYRYLLAQEMIEGDEGDESKDHKRKVEDRRHDAWMRHMQYEHPEYFEGPVEQLSSELDKAEHDALAGIQKDVDKPCSSPYEESSSACWEGPADQLNAWECEEVQDLGLLSAEDIRENIRANTAAIESLRAISKARATKEAIEAPPASTPASESSLTAEETPNQPERMSEEVPFAQSTSPTENPDSNHPTSSLTPPEEDQAQPSQPERSLAFMPLSPVVDSPSNQDSANIARTTYRTLIYEPTNDIITEITSESPMTSDAAIPLYSALARLNTPGKFLQRVVDRLGTGDEIIAAQGNVLAIRKAPEHLETVDKITGISDIPLPRFGTRPAESQPKSADDGSEAAGFQPEKDNTPTEAYAINPIDGTMAASLSPTGYAGVDPTIEAAENDPYADEDGALRKAYWDKTRQEHNSRGEPQAVGRRDRWSRASETGEKKVKERGRTAGVAKTALWAATVCYVASIAAELLK